MTQSIVSLALVVRDYDEALAFFTQALRFTLIEDTDMSGGKRWVVVAPTGEQGASLLLAKAANEGTVGPRGQSDRRARVLVLAHD